MQLKRVSKNPVFNSTSSENIPVPKRGGTEIYCPKCEEFTSCEGIDISQFGSETSYFIRYDRGQRRSVDKKYPDLKYFARGRQCAQRGHKFVTVELHEDLLYELKQFRDRMGGLRQDMEIFTAGAPATEQLAALSSLVTKLQDWVDSIESDYY